MTKKEIDKLRLIELLKGAVPFSMIYPYYCNNCYGNEKDFKCIDSKNTKWEYFRVSFEHGKPSRATPVGRCFKKKNIRRKK